MQFFFSRAARIYVKGLSRSGSDSLPWLVCRHEILKYAAAKTQSPSLILSQLGEDGRRGSESSGRGVET